MLFLNKLNLGQVYLRFRNMIAKIDLFTNDTGDFS